MEINKKKCPCCESEKILEKNPTDRKIWGSIICDITSECMDCGEIFTYKSWTIFGKSMGVIYNPV